MRTFVVTYTVTQRVNANDKEQAWENAVIPASLSTESTVDSCTIDNVEITEE